MDGPRLTLLVAIALLLVSGCVQQQTIGGDRDVHGCLIAAGYQWCPSRDACMRMWEEYCEEYAEQFNDENISSFEGCEEAGFPVMESHPRQCRTNTGKTFAEQTEVKPGRNESVFIRGNDGIAIRGLAFPPYREQLSLARDMGANYIAYGHWIVPDINGNIVPPGSASWTSNINETRERIRMLHDEGFMVWLYIRTPLQPADPGESTSEFTFELNPALFSGLSAEARERFLGALKTEILEVARMAEEEKVEMFGPVAAGQLYLVLEPRSDGDFSYRWADALIPEVREVYSGDLAQKIDLNPDTGQNKKILEIANFTGWDWVSSDIFGSCDGFPGGQGEVDSYDEWRHIYTSMLGVLKAKKAESGAKGILFGPEMLGIDSSAHRIIMAEKGYGSIDDIPLSDWEEARAKAWDMMLNDTAGEVDGYFFWSWWPGSGLPDYEYDKEVDGQTIRSRKSPGNQGSLPSEVIKRHYSG